MAWTAVTAAILALSINWSYRQRMEALPWAMSIVSAIYSTIVGWILLGSLRIGWHAVRRTLWPLEPGEWMLLGLLAVIMANWVDAVWFALTFPRRLADPYQYETFQSLQWWRGIRQVVLAAGVAMAWIAIAALVWRQRLWAWAIGAGIPAMVLLVINLLFVKARWLNVVWLGGGVIAAYVSLGLILAASLGDWRHGVSRHWLHWSGVVLVTLALAAVALSITVGFLSQW